MLTPEPLHVLIIDDSPTDTVTFRRHLTRGVQSPCVVTDVDTAAKAMKQLAETLPDCVLLDFHLPDSNGVNLVRAMVAEYGTNAFGIVMMTSNQDIELAVEALRSGAHDFLPKSSTNAIVLRRAVDNAVEKAAIQRELDAQRLVLAQKNEELQVHIQRLEQEVNERRRADALLRQSEQQLRLVTDHAAVLLAHCDHTLSYKFVNRPYAMRFGAEPEEIIGKKVISVMGHEAFEALLPHLNSALEGNSVEFEIEIPYHDLGRRWMNVVYVPERSTDGKVVGLIGVMSDTTARKKVELELEHARDEALEASGAKDDFLAALSHELRTPLNPILLLSSDAAQDTELSEPIRAVFETIRKNVELEARLIDDLLNITQISRGKMPLNKIPVDVHVILADALANVRAEIAGKHLALHVNCDAPEHTVSGDAVRLQQIFWNILKNAIKFTPEGGSITVQTQTLKATGMVEIRVTDTGLGMSEQELARVFEAFTQGDHAGEGGSHRFGGLGLGLAISHMLVESHSGHIAAQSRGPGHGSSFSILFPLVEECVQEKAPVDPKLDGVSYNGEPNLQILLVEDHEATRNALALLLKRRHYQVQTAGCTKEALELAAKTHFDLLISDIGLPDGNGYDLMKELYTQHGLKGIALTGYGMERDIHRSNAVGFVQHLTKPIQMKSLEEAIQAALALA